MKIAYAKTTRFAEDAVPMEGMRLGRIVSTDESGSVFVDFPGNTFGPLVARTTTSSNANTLRQGKPSGREVLLAFANNHPRHPIIVDTIYSPLDEIIEPETAAVESEEPQEIKMDGKRITYNAENEIVLKCGKASITLTKAGKILIKGEYVLSHSSGENRIKGGSISMN